MSRGGVDLISAASRRRVGCFCIHSGRACRILPEFLQESIEYATEHRRNPARQLTGEGIDRSVLDGTYLDKK